jgi:Tfp pilus assembly protein PilE
MKTNDRGFALMELGIVLGILLALGALLYGVTSYLEHVETEARAAERKAVLLEVADRDNKKLAAALARVKELEAAARGEEQRKQSAVNAAVTVHAKEKADVEEKHDRLVARLRNGDFGLRDAGAEGGGRCPGSGERGGAAVAGDPAGGPGRVEGRELFRQDGEFLVAEARRADLKLKALQLCRATLKAERAPPGG